MTSRCRKNIWQPTTNEASNNSLKWDVFDFAKSTHLAPTLGGKRMMNYPIIIAGSIVFLAFIAHTFVGYREALSTRPRVAPAVEGNEAVTIERNWVQSLCAFQLVTVDLFVLSVLLLLLGTTEVLPARREFALIAAGFFVLWGAVWIVQLLILRRRLKDYLLLGQWAIWFVCAGLLLWGAQSL